MMAAARIEPLRKPGPCPQCGRQSSRNDYRFCSRRCATIDLGRWFSGAYALSRKAGADGSGSTAAR